jgi:hypothetical protein
MWSAFVLPACKESLKPSGLQGICADLSLSFTEHLTTPHRFVERAYTLLT